MKQSVQLDPLWLDLTCEATDEVVGIEIQPRPHGRGVLYVCVNGRTFLRLNRIPKLVFQGQEVSICEDGTLTIVQPVTSPS